MRSTDINIKPVLIEIARLDVKLDEVLLLRCAPEDVDRLLRAVSKVRHDYPFKIMVSSNEVEFTVIKAANGPV